MRIAIEYTPAVRQRAGIGRFTRDLIGALVRIDTANEYVLVVAGESPEEKFPSHVTVKRLPFSERAALISWHRLHLPLPITPFLGKVDLYHGTNFLLPPLGSVPGVVTIHDLTFLVHPEFADPGLASFLAREVPRSLKAATAICADSAATKDDLVQRLGVDPSRVAVILGGVDPRFTPTSDEERGRIAAKYPVDRPYLLALGTREPRKNLVGLLDAYDILRARGFAPRVLVAGPGGWREEGFASRLAGSSYKDDVISLGFVPDEDLPGLLSMAACFVYPSYYEGFGLPVLEALACGVPVVCGNRSSLLEVAGDVAVTVPPDQPAAIAEAIGRILTDEHYASALRAAGPGQASLFQWETEARKLLGVYSSVIAGKNVA